MENNEGRVVPANLKKQLALAVRSIQWSYGIFWSISTRQPGILEWGDGYYNGDIKTRKTVQSMDFNRDHQIGLQRSDQLRELYESLSTGESNPQLRRPSAALSPEDLTDTEWYYLVCMSFIFDIGQGLPGRTLATNRPIWICNAPVVDSKVFTRSLLAKSALVQTVVCFPFLGGVIELGATEQVSEDPSLIRHVKTSFLEVLNPIASRRFITNAIHRNSKDLGYDALGHDFEEPRTVPLVGDLPEISLCSSSGGFEPTAFPESSFTIDGANAIASHALSWENIHDDFPNCVNASDCIPEALLEPSVVLQGDESLEFARLAVLDDQTNDHYQNILSAVLKTSGQLITGKHFRNGGRVSSFIHWKKGEFLSSQRIHKGTAQKLLKKILSEVPQMHKKGIATLEGSVHRQSASRPEADDVVVNHTLSERRRRKKINEHLTTLKSMIPLTDKIDKVSLLDETIEYLQELESRVDELESSTRAGEGELRPKRKSPDAALRTSNDSGCSKKLQSHERKVYGIDNSKAGDTTALAVRINERNVLVELRCVWREGLLLEIITEMNNLQLETHSVRSSTAHGILSLTIASKFMGSTAISAATIKQALERFASRRSQ